MNLFRDNYLDIHRSRVSFGGLFGVSCGGAKRLGGRRGLEPAFPVGDIVIPENSGAPGFSLYP